MTEFKKEIYKNEKGEKLYRKSFCVYFDILGFSEKIKNDDQDFFETYLTTLDNEVKYLNEQHDLDGSQGFKSFELKIFTDNFVIGYPWYDEFGESELGDIFDAISHLQVSFALSNIFIRGAIALSDLYMDENIVLGQALLEAYNLENKLATFPRIIISEQVFDVVKKHIGFYADKKTSPQNSEYLIDIDGQVFINYLTSIVDNYHTAPDKVGELLLKHKTIIIENLNKNKENYKLLEKYQWIADYHNHFCNNGLTFVEGIDIEPLLIDVTIIRKAITSIF
jgi:hypothetical protein